jgi:hypothetical protein
MSPTLFTWDKGKERMIRDRHNPNAFKFKITYKVVLTLTFTSSRRSDMLQLQVNSKV